MKRIVLIFTVALCLVALWGITVTAAAASGDPVLYTNKWRAFPGERASLSWDEPDFDGDLSLWRWKGADEPQYIGNAPKKTDGYSIVLPERGVWYYCLTGTRKGTQRQSNTVEIRVTPQGGKKATTAGDPVIYSNKTSVRAGEHFALSWYEYRADGDMTLWKRMENTDYEFVAYVPKHSDGYDITLDQNGTWYFSLMASIDGQAHQSDEFCVLVGASQEEADLRLAQEKGMNNTWNMLFLIYENVNIGNFRESFSANDIARIEMYARDIKYTMEGITAGRMQIGTVETIRISTPITSASSGLGSDCRALTYGPGGDVNFDDLLENRDVNAVAVFAPIGGLPGTGGWLGLAPFKAGKEDTECYVLIINDVDLNVTYYNMEGISYMEESTALVHELLHCVEQNSRDNGWEQFEALHDVEENGYRFEHGNLLWYKDLTRNQLKNGHKGFKRISFYVKHR